MNSSGFVLAYHGCDRKTGESILGGSDHVRPSTNAYDWLGSGAYFWEGSPERALQWARFLHDHPRAVRPAIRKPFVVGAIIAPGHCLNLTAARDLDVLRRAYMRMESGFRLSGESLPVNSRAFASDKDLIKRGLDCAVCEFLHESRKEDGQPAFDTLRAAFFEGGLLYPGAGFSARTHIQWCVRNPKRSIRGYFRPILGSDKSAEDA